ncbi:MAG: hypothetical protein KGZ70_04085 [Hydrogenophaga sp.]|uniref:hypothetical protein n=1 Tax=Hydrogenophaga sp. TaxID=1904254 RepID=UPI001BBE738C|nr:hypothetical protein [Hydrogenophaga sp.]MBS3911003.1 hypothetical protein [Hydrogenophaga sp.]MDO9149425.1 hypothetical protein [Hydrogenophaga sp.]MDO9602957.1 hypothetical protein [Hydrogenophaga sp.]MDP2166358.1 hypothetical protein [Hydrogenophaga sp.]MDP3475760.1 hypothetical protein [Hydrogenophaga sp.]
MNGFSDFLGRVVSGIVKLVFGLALAIFVLSLLLAVLAVVLVASVWSLLTGRKPAPVVMFNHFRQTSQRYAGGVWSGRPGAGHRAGRGADLGDVVDVQAHEVPEPAASGSVGGAPRSVHDPVVRTLP